MVVCTGGHPDACTWLRLVKESASRFFLCCILQPCNFDKLANCSVAVFAVLHDPALHVAVLYFAELRFERLQFAVLHFNVMHVAVLHVAVLHVGFVAFCRVSSVAICCVAFCCAALSIVVDCVQSSFIC